jgi:hypothetical protein
MGFLFHVSLPGKSELLVPLRELAARVVEYAGYRQDDARELTSVITEGAAEAMRQASTAPLEIDLQFETDDDRFEVTLSYPDHAGSRSGSIKSFVCGREGDRNVCRMARNLPIEPSS